MLPGVSLKVTLDRKLTAMVHCQGDEEGGSEGGLVLGQYSTGMGKMVSQRWVPRFQSSPFGKVCAGVGSSCSFWLHGTYQRSAVKITDPVEPFKWRQRVFIVSAGI